MKKKLIITGSTGFLGNLFLTKNSLKNIDIICVGSENKKINKKYNQITFDNFSNTYKEEGHEIFVLHLATFYSKSDKDREKINSAFNFSMNILNFVKDLNLINFLYTNTMFIFDENESNHYYTKSKKIFSDNLTNTINNDKISEIFLSDTFHFNDERKKVTPLIVSSVLENKKSPVKNKDKYINLVYGEDLVNCLSNEIFNTKYSISRVTSKVDLKINSIYNFLKFLNETGQINKSLIDSKVSQYELDNNIPQLNKNFKESNIIEKLSTLIKVED